MRSQISLLQVLGSCLAFAASGMLMPLITISRNPFAAAPFWIVSSALALLLIGLVLGLLAGRFPPQFKPTRLQWLDISVLWLWLFIGGFLLSTHGTKWLAAGPIVLVTVIVFGMRLWSNRSPKSS